MFHISCIDSSVYVYLEIKSSKTNLKKFDNKNVKIFMYGIQLNNKLKKSKFTFLFPGSSFPLNIIFAGKFVQLETLIIYHVFSNVSVTFRLGSRYCEIGLISNSDLMVGCTMVQLRLIF